MPSEFCVKKKVRVRAVALRNYQCTDGFYACAGWKCRVLIGMSQNWPSGASPFGTQERKRIWPKKLRETLKKFRSQRRNFKMAWSSESNAAGKLRKMRPKIAQWVWHAETLLTLVVSPWFTCNNSFLWGFMECWWSRLDWRLRSRSSNNSIQKCQSTCLYWAYFLQKDILSQAKMDISKDQTLIGNESNSRTIITKATFF